MTNTAIQWLKDNEIVVNPSKLQLMFLSKYKNIGKTTTSSAIVELLGFTLDKNDSFKQYVRNICHKANNKFKNS